MRKLSLIITTSVLLIACGSSAENNVTETTEVPQQVKNVVVEEVVEVALEESEIVESKEIATPIVEEEMVAVKEKALKKEVVTKTVVVKKMKEGKVTEVQQTGVQAMLKPSHDTWNTLTQMNVTADGKVNYKGMKAEMNQLILYLSHLQNTPPKTDWTKNEKLAYWINLYNASTVYLIASNYPVSSITKLNGGKPWDKKFVKSGNKIYSLNDIENTIVRPQFKDPRIHAALNCAAVSCPKMLNGAFLPGKLSAQLDKQCVAWINDANRNVVSPNSLKLSQIFDWYAADFKVVGGVVVFINKYNKSKIIVNPKAKISYLEYNWGLNE